MGAEMREAIERAIRAHLPGRTVQTIRDRGVWVRHTFEVALDDGEVVWLKMDVDPDWLEGGRREAQVAQLFEAHGLPAPRVLAVDASCAVVPHPYVVQEHVGGTRLGDLLDRVDEVDALAVYETLGRFYRRMHAIHNDRSGIWIESPDQPLEVSPNEYMYRAEIVEGSGRRALEQGRISHRTYDRAVALWATHMDSLKDHQPSLIHYSPFPWTIYLDRADDGWRVTKLTALGDVMWWDPACNLASLRYPPFGRVSPAHWDAFLWGYGSAPARRRILLYAVLQRLCAAMGVYMEPRTARNRAWAETCLQDLDAFMDAIEREV